MRFFLVVYLGVCFSAVFAYSRSYGNMTMNEDLVGREIWVEMDEEKRGHRTNARRSVNRANVKFAGS